VSGLAWSLGCASGDARPKPATPDGEVAGTSGGSAGTSGAAGVGATGGTNRDAAASDQTTDSADVPTSVPDASSIDSADSSEASEAGTSAACKTSGTELCDDFESGTIDPKVWTTHTTSGATLTVDAAHVHSGAHALHVKLVAGAQQTAQIADAMTFPAKNNTFYTRAYFYFSPDLPADMMGGYHMAYLLATGNNDLGFVEAGLGSAGNKQVLGYSEYYGDGPDVHAHGPTFTEFGPDSSTKLVPKTWLCLELMQGGDATTTHRRIWVDGTELLEQVSDYSDRKPPQFSLMSIGVLQYHATPLLTDVWIDDVRVSSARIGCDATPP
jgi:hypothetical protein